MTTGNLSNPGAPADGTATQNPAPAHGSLLKAGIAAAVVAGLALAFVGGWWFGTKRNMRSARSSDGDTSSERDGRKEGGSHGKVTRSSRSSDGDSSSERDRREEVGSHGKVQLWEDGPYWAETNIGAEKPEDYGYYFWWGDTVGYKWDGYAWVASDGSSRDFSIGSENLPTYRKSIDELKREGWITKDGVLAPGHDAAHVLWGGDWRMPTRQEQDGLVWRCDWTWTTKNGVNGYIVRGRGGYASASIFLPCAGYGNGTSFRYAGSNGCYWSSVPVPDRDGYVSRGLFFSSSDSGPNYDSRDYGTLYDNRDCGLSVRPVQGFTK